MKSRHLLSLFQLGLASLWVLSGLLLPWQVGSLPAIAQSETAPNTGTQTPRFRWQFHALPVANLVYQLDCLGGQGHCSWEAYRQLWQKDLNWQAADQTQLAQWKKIKARYQLQWRFESGPKHPQSRFPLRFEGLDLSRKFRLPGLESQDLSDYLSRVSLLLAPSDAEKMHALLTHFYPRFETWWVQQAAGPTEAAAKELMDLLQKEQLAQWAETAARFYQSLLPAESHLNFHFFYRPGEEGTQNGEQIENHSLIEVMPSKPLKNQVSVILHELNHYFYTRSTPAQHAQLVQFFASRSEAWAIPAYNLLNEVMATALANGLVMETLLSPESYQRYFTSPGSFYADRYIDPVAKALLPRLKRALNQQESLYSPAFLKDYLDTVKLALGDQALAPALFLRTAGLVSEGPEAQAASELLSQELRIGTSWGSQNLRRGFAPFESYPALSGAVFITPDQISELQSWGPVLPLSEFRQIQSRAGQKRPFIWGFKRGASAWLYVFVGKTPQQFQALIARFKTEKKIFQGLRTL